MTQQLLLGCTPKIKLRTYCACNLTKEQRRAINAKANADVVESLKQALYRKAYELWHKAKTS